ncbi:DUF541 domain-containing protein [Paenibacillus cremeus]|uniref:DUF541 domain-containing protein n=2 Tax=Paenibacillus cremeus TaxID=2163881 RepID=A0A559K580_9BACL|nr:DUF541 domain-containing protein [Paenibacillus cremeus]
MTMTQAVPSGQRNTLEVIGEGSSTAAPDKAVIVLGAITENVSLSVAQKENADAVTSILSALTKLGIPKEQMQTVTYRIDTQYDYADGHQTFRGYQVTHMLQITIPNVDRTGLVVDTAVASGANQVNSIQFAMAHPEQHYRQALAEAVADARLKALTIAGALGVTLYPVPVQVQERSLGAEPSPLPMAKFAMASATPIQPGELKIAAAVKLVFTY